MKNPSHLYSPPFVDFMLLFLKVKKNIVKPQMHICHASSCKCTYTQKIVPNYYKKCPYSTGAACVPPQKRLSDGRIALETPSPHTWDCNFLKPTFTTDSRRGCEKMTRVWTLSLKFSLFHCVHNCICHCSLREQSNATQWMSFGRDCLRMCLIILIFKQYHSLVVQNDFKLLIRTNYLTLMIHRIWMIVWKYCISGDISVWTKVVGPLFGFLP